MKRTVYLILTLLFVLGFGSTSAQTAALIPPQLAGIFEAPGFITSAGQTSDAAIVKVLVNTRLKLNFGYDIAAKPQAVSGAKTLVLVLGASNKGLGAAGLSIEQETERVKVVLALAKSEHMRIIAMHTGGTARRGESSNAIIALCVPYADVAIVVEGGNNDGFFTDLCAKEKVPLVMVPSIAEAGNVLKGLMAK
ncbi:MAG: DUF6305 family protein [Spirochaetota bacterium]|jgi:hypothetical protein